MLAPIFKGLRGLFVIIAWGGILIAINEYNPEILSGWKVSFPLYGMFLVLALTWVYYGTGQHLKPDASEG